MRIFIKNLIEKIFLIMISPFILLSIITKPIDKSGNIFLSINEFLSLFPGTVGIYIRRAYYNTVLKNGCHNLSIGFGSVIVDRNSTIEKNVYIGSQCNIGVCHIEKDVLIGTQVNIISGKHVHFFDDINTPIRHQGGKLKKIIIGEGSWLANNSTILEDINKGCVVGAGAVMVKPSEKNGIYAGNPAKLIRYRGEKK